MSISICAPTSAARRERAAAIRVLKWLQVAMTDRSLPILVLLLREAREMSVRSAATFRWSVEPCRRVHGGDPGPEGPGGAWRLRLLRGRMSLPGEIRGRIESEEGLAAVVEASFERPDASFAAADFGWSERPCAG